MALTTKTKNLMLLLAHHDADHLDAPMLASVYARSLPRPYNYLVYCGLPFVLDLARDLSISRSQMDTLLADQQLGPLMRDRPRLVHALEALNGFEGEIESVPEGTLLFAGPAFATDGSAVEIANLPLSLYTPMMQMRGNVLGLRLIMEAWSSLIGYLTGIASKAARLVDAAAGKPIIDGSSSSVHPAVAHDAMYASRLGGCAGSALLSDLSNPPGLGGGMDHLWVQANARTRGERAEAVAFDRFLQLFPDGIVIVDTYSTADGIRLAAAALKKLGSRAGLRIDSQVDIAFLRDLRSLLAEHGVHDAKIVVSGGLDEAQASELAPHVDVFNIGSAIARGATVSPVAKVVINSHGVTTIRVAARDGRAVASMPGKVQVYRATDHDLIAFADEPAPSGATPLLQPVWRGKEPRVQPDANEARRWVRTQIEALPAALRSPQAAATPRPFVVSDRLLATLREIAQEIPA